MILTSLKNVFTKNSIHEVIVKSTDKVKYNKLHGYITLKVKAFDYWVYWPFNQFTYNQLTLFVPF